MSEMSAAFLQLAVTLILAAVTGALHQRFRRRHFAFWTIAWILYAGRLGAILCYMSTNERLWLYWHQVATGWTALALLWGAMSFSEPQRWRRRHLAWLAFPLVWSAIAIFRLDNFLLAAAPAVLFLAVATWWTAWTFRRYARRATSGIGWTLAIALALWGVHHLDYPFLRARGAWNPWGYYLDVLFELTMGVGLVLLVVEDLHRGIATLSALSRELQHAPDRPDVSTALLERVRELPGVEGALLITGLKEDRPDMRAVGRCESWTLSNPLPVVADVVRDVSASREPIVRPGNADDPSLAIVSGLPLHAGRDLTGVLVVVGDSRDPFAALDRTFLAALGEQIGGALELSARTRDLRRLAAQMVQQHEIERQRVARELHDETAQVFTAVKLQVGVLEERVSPAIQPAVREAISLLEQGIQSIRNVTTNLRPPILDDLGLQPALFALVDEFRNRNVIPIHFDAHPLSDRLSKEAELVLFRALQEALSNVVRHAGATEVRVTLSSNSANVTLRVEDDGRGFDGGRPPRNWGMGLAGMRERVAALDGHVHVANGAACGAVVSVTVPFETDGTS